MPSSLSRPPRGRYDAVIKILITGAGRAIGGATASELSARGHEVVASARDVRLLDDLNVAVKISHDALVNNAALPGGGPLETMPLDRFRALFETNVVGPLRLIQALTPQWRSREHGVVVNVSSVEGRVAGPLSAATPHRSSPSRDCRKR